MSTRACYVAATPSKADIGIRVSVRPVVSDRA